jgi:hypothetical protein
MKEIYLVCTSDCDYHAVIRAFSKKEDAEECCSLLKKLCDKVKEENENPHLEICMKNFSEYERELILYASIPYNDYFSIETTDLY